jgi:hypothetical protein
VAEEFGVVITKAGLSQRFNAAGVEFMRVMFEQALSLWQPQPRFNLSLFKPFGGVYLLDSTYLTLSKQLASSYPGSGGHGSPAGLKLQTTYDYLRGQVESVTEQSGNQPDQSFKDRLEELPEASLGLFDMGYCTLARLKGLIKAKRYFLTRLPCHLLLYRAGENAPLDLVEALRQTAGEVVELELELGQKERLPVRLVAQVVPAAAQLKRLAQAQAASRRKGRELSSKQAVRLGWNVYISNVPATWLSGVQLSLVYHVRWQIELLFKVWKSGLALDHTSGKQAFRLLCEIYAKLIGLVMLVYLSSASLTGEVLEDAELELEVSKLGSTGSSSEVQPTPELSLTKLLQSFKGYILRLGQALVNHKPKKVAKMVKKLWKKWRKYGQKLPQNQRPTTYEQLLAVQTPHPDRLVQVVSGG